jgi:predicted RNase H-like nuclease (RuvC/YqgF family)
VFTPEEIQKNRHRDECTRCELKDQIKRETRTLSDYRKQLEQLTHRRGFLEKTIPAHEMKIEQLKADLKAAPRRAKEKVAC